MGKKVILCVDDERIVLQSLRDQLVRNFKERYTYEFAESPEEALEVLEELVEDDTEILIVVSDWLMPTMRGDDFLVKVHEKFPKIVKIMLTGQADESAVERAKQYANLHSCIAKPWSETTLIETIGSGLGE